jgi:SAM-dependent methyltransferase
MPFNSDVVNPLLDALKDYRRKRKTKVADIGCGKGHLLEIIAPMFDDIVALDFSEKMLDLSRKRLGDSQNIAFVQGSMTDLSAYRSQFDLITATSSIVLHDPLDREQAFREIFLSLKPGGRLLGIVPAIDAVLYYAGLLYASARREGLDEADARRRALEDCDASDYDFALGLFHWDGIRQKFYHRFEVENHLTGAGFSDIRLEKVLYPWGHAVEAATGFETAGCVWDWFFSAVRPKR